MFTSDMTRKPPETYVDLKEQNYTVYIPNIEIMDSGGNSAFSFISNVINHMTRNNR